MILSADWHLDDNPINNYRWNVFDRLMDLVESNSDEEVALLGDIFDRKDRHSGNLVNRFVHEIKQIAEKTKIYILMGNHDKPISGIPYWTFLNRLKNVFYITEPLSINNVLFLPFSANPAEEWKRFKLEEYKTIFMHQPVDGATLENGMKYYAKTPMPTLPKKVPIYSGDIHTPQKVGSVIYVGAPHPIDFGDSYLCRMITTTGIIYHEIPLQPIQRQIVRSSNLSELQERNFKKGDQIRLMVTIDPDRVEQWPVEQEAIFQWAKEQEIEIVSSGADCSPEGSVSQNGGIINSEGELKGFEGTDVSQILSAFCNSLSLDPQFVIIGEELLREGMNAIRSA